MDKKLFSNVSAVPAAATRNAAGGKAYQLSAAVALTKYAATGVFGDTYQATAATQLDKVLELCQQVDPQYLAQLAIYSRREARLKDVPAFLAAYLAHADIELCKTIFSRVIDSPKMLRNFVTVMRSGVVGRKSLGTAPKRLIQNYLNGLTDEQLFRANVGSSPSLRDIVRMVHPKPENKSREALYAYLLGKEVPVQDDKDHLLPLVRQFEAFKKDVNAELPKVPWEFLTSLPLTTEQWKGLARNCSFEQVRQNLNTFGRHGVLEDPQMVELLATKLSDPEEVRRSRVFPYQLFMAFLNADVDKRLKNALEAAMEVSLENVPQIEGETYIALDTSGSMSSHVTGDRGSATSKARYSDLAAVYAAALLRTNKNAHILPFDTQVHLMDLNPADGVMSMAGCLSKIRGGGTDCSSPIRYLNEKKAKADNVIMISDNESWRAYAGKRYGKGTPLMAEWAELTKRSPGAKLVNVDISPSDTTQTANVANTLLVGGFNDSIFNVIASFLRKDFHTDEYWSHMVNQIKL